MNRLWVRLSIVIACIVIFITVLPFAIRLFDTRPEGFQKPPPPGISQERFAEIQDAIEKRTWTNLTRMLLIGAGLALVAGVFLSRWLVRPLRKLEEGARAFAERRLNHRIPIQGSDEMQSVALSFNRMAEDLEQQETLRHNLLADVTHELRHPIHILRGSLQAILDGVYSLNMEEIASLSEQTQHLTALVNDLHELAQAEAQQLQLHKQMADLRTVVTNGIETFQPLSSEKGITLQINLPHEHVSCNIDATRIRQAFQNLLSNALAYTPTGGEITVTLIESKDEVKISVRDTGIGITAENLPHVFDRFYRADASRNRQLGGTGLGLAIAQAIIQAHGGIIEAYSAGKDQGSTFTIIL